MSGLKGSLQFPGDMSLRFARRSDDPFLLKLFMAARPWIDWTSHDEKFVRFLYEDQLRLARLGVGTVYPEFQDFIVVKTGQDVGHLTINLGRQNWHIAQLELHPEAQGKGIGGDILRGLKAAAGKARLPLTVYTPQVLPRAVTFYRRHGFRLVAKQAPMFGLTWHPPGHPLAAAAEAAEAAILLRQGGAEAALV
jgi:GNAT superfamily N-acetyltransferase